MKERALLLAAGKSTRIHPVSKGRPKPLLDVGGDAIIARNLRWLAAEGVRELFINLHYRPDEIKAFVGDGSSFGVNVRYSLEEQILGTAGAVKKLESEFTDRFLVVYGDNLLSSDLSVLVSEHEAKGAEATVAVFDRNRHPHTGIAGGRVRVGPDDRILEFAEGAGDHVSSLVNAGVYVLEPSILRDIPSDTFYDFGKDVFPGLLARGASLYASRITGYCLGIDTPESFERALELVSSKEITLR